MLTHSMYMMGNSFIFFITHKEGKPFKTGMIVGSFIKRITYYKDKKDQHFSLFKVKYALNALDKH